MYRNQYLPQITAVFIISALLSFSGCGGINKNGMDRLHIALAAPMSGVNSAVGTSMMRGAQLYLDELNRKGGIRGCKVVLDIHDDQNDPEIAAEKANIIVRENRALAVIGHYYSSCSISAGKVYKKEQIPAVTPVSTNTKVTEGNDWYFRTTFNDKLQGRYLANYAHKVLGYNTVSIIHEDLEYGSYLARVFEDNCRELNITVKYKWRFSVDDENLDDALERIVFDLQKKTDPGVIFLATHRPEGVKLLKMMKDAFIRSPVMGPDAFASKIFREAFQRYRKEKRHPGYYTDGLYVTMPLSFDMVSETGHDFFEAYKEVYRFEPDWIAAFSYDTMMLLTEAIRLSNISMPLQNPAEVREKIRRHLTNVDSIEEAMEGVSGFTYFDENGDSQKPIYAGIYRNGRMISALTQVQTIPNIRNITDFKSKVDKNRVIFFDGRYMFNTKVVYTGIEINKFSDLDIKNLTYTFDFFLWFRYQGDFDVDDIEFLNSVDEVELGEPIDQSEKENLTYRLYRVNGRFRADFVPRQNAFGQYVLGIQFRHRHMTRDYLIYVNDAVGMRFGDKRSDFKRLKKAQVHSPLQGWTIDRMRFSQDIEKKNPLGNPDYLSAGGAVKYSGFNASIWISNNKFTLRGLLPNRYVGVLLALSCFVLVMISYGDHISLIRNHREMFWFVQGIFAFLFLLSCEVVFINLLADKISAYNLKFVMLFFNIMWWFMPAYLATIAFELFFWRPIEERTSRTIPNILRRFVSLVIYLLAIFGIVAFVFGERLTSLLATSGVIAMIIGLAIQINIANIFSGIAINLETPFRIGDWVKIGQFDEGKVIDINWRTTRLHTRNDCVLSIPNSQASESPIQNFSFPTNGYWKYITVHVDVHNSPERVKKILLDAILSCNCVQPEPKPGTKFLGLTAEMTGQSVTWAANYLCSSYVKDYADKFSHNEEIWSAIWTHLKNAGINHVMERREVLMMLEGIKHREKQLPKPLSIISRLDLFRPFSEEAKYRLSQSMRNRRFLPGDTVVREGDAGDSLFIVEEGSLGAWITVDGGREIEVGRLGAGDIFGEMALLTGERRTASIISATETQLYEITKDDIAPFIAENPDISRMLSDVLTERKLAMEMKKNAEAAKDIDKNTLASQILGRIQNFFGFR